MRALLAAALAATALAGCTENEGPGVSAAVPVEVALARETYTIEGTSLGVDHTGGPLFGGYCYLGSPLLLAMGGGWHDLERSIDDWWWNLTVDYFVWFYDADYYLLGGGTGSGRVPLASDNVTICTQSTDRLAGGQYVFEAVGP